MEQILVTLNGNESTYGIRKAIGMLRGVASTSIVKNEGDTKRKRQEAAVRQSLYQAMGQVEAAKRGECQLQSSKDFLEELEAEGF